MSLFLTVESVADVFTRLCQLFPAPPTSDPAYKSILANRTRHLLKYIFPLQFGLSSPFRPASVVGSGFGKLRAANFTDREVDIKRLGKVKTPARLKGELEQLTTRMINLVEKCKTKPLLDRWCPTKVSWPRSIGPARGQADRGTCLVRFTTLGWTLLNAVQSS